MPEGFRDWNQHIGTGPLQIRVDLTTELDGPPAEAYGYASDGEVLLAEYGIARNRMTPRELWKPRLREFAERWEEWKKATGRVDFTDMIETALHEVSKLPGDPAVFMLDEAQDLSKLEMALARQWGEHTDHFVIVGDPDQNLYEWRGSDPEAFTAVEAATERTLEQSWRVPRAVHRYAVDWIEKIEERPPIKYEPRDEDGEVRLERTSWTHPDQLVKQTEGHLEEGKSVMFLTSCAFMLEPLIRVLRQQGVPFHNPYRVKQGAWNPMRSAYRVLSFLSPSFHPEMLSLADAFGTGLWSWGELKAWTEPLLAAGVMVRGKKSLVEAHCQKDRFGESEAQETPTLEELLELFEPEHHEALREFSLEWWESKLRTKKKQTYAYPLEVVKRRGADGLKDEPSVVVGTIHSVKGGEADHVYVFPDVSRRGAEEARTSSGRNAAIRQYYVAFTRAREVLHICRPDAQWYLQLPEP